MPATVNGRFALNHMVAPTLDVAAFFDLAVGLGTRSVEIRNDIKGVEILTGRGAADIAALAAAKKITILSINALQRFNDWSSARAMEAEQLAAFATACGAKALVLCPVNDTSYTPSAADKAQNLRTALKELQPILAARHLTGLVEPLGFVECSLRRKAEAIAAIDDTGTGATFKVLHDTFHHLVAGETELFPQRTGLVHISGVSDAEISVDVMRDPHRVLIDKSDRIDNAGQIARLIAGGYAGPLSFEPFASIGSSAPAIAAALKSSMEFLAAA